MGSQNRKVMREQLKKEYNNFALAWQLEKYHQANVQFEGIKPEERLGKRPSFKAWLAFKEAQAEQEANKLRGASQEELTDLSWDEGSAEASPVEQSSPEDR